MPSPICALGPEFSVGALNELEFTGAQPGVWPYVCGPSAGTDLRTDASLGLWVPPREPLESAALYQQSAAVSLPLGAYTNPITFPPGDTVGNPSLCFPMQAVVAYEVTCKLLMPADVTVKVSPWIGPASGPVPAAGALPVYKTLHQQGAWSGTGNVDSVTMSLTRRLAVPPATSVALTAQAYFYPTVNPGSTGGTPSMTAATIIFYALGWLLTDGSQPISD